jgi:hypothetical protein
MFMKLGVLGLVLALFAACSDGDDPYFSECRPPDECNGAVLGGAGGGGGSGATGGGGSGSDDTGDTADTGDVTTSNTEQAE